MTHIYRYGKQCQIDSMQKIYKRERTGFRPIA